MDLNIHKRFSSLGFRPLDAEFLGWTPNVRIRVGKELAQMSHNIYKTIYSDYISKYCSPRVSS